MPQPRQTTQVVGQAKNERLLTCSQFGDETNTGERFARRLIAERRIRFVKMGRKVRIPESAIAEFLAAGTVQPVSPGGAS